MEKALRKVYNSRKLTLLLKTVSVISVILTVFAYSAILFHAFYQSRKEGLTILLPTAIPFLLITIIRRLINAPRPYELYDFYKIKPKEKSGRSFPSRHVFSAFVIGTTSLIYTLELGFLVLIFAALMAAARVLLGIHFIRDVVAGAVIGAISGAIGIFGVYYTVFMLY